MLWRQGCHEAAQSPTNRLLAEVYPMIRRDLYITGATISQLGSTQNVWGTFDWKPMIFSTPNFETMFNKKLTEHQPDFHIGRVSALGTWKRMLVWCNTQQTQLTANWTAWACISYDDYYKGYLESNYMLSLPEVTWSDHRNLTKSMSTMSYQYQVEYGESRKMWKVTKFVVDLAPEKKGWYLQEVRKNIKWRSSSLGRWSHPAQHQLKPPYSISILTN